MRFLNSACVRLLAAAGCVASAAMAGNIVANPGFETGDFTSWTTNSGWDIIGTGGTAGVFPHTGSFFANTGCVGTTCIQADSSGSPDAAWFYQDLATVPGTLYDLTFYFAPGEVGGL